MAFSKVYDAESKIGQSIEDFKPETFQLFKQQKLPIHIHWRLGPRGGGAEKREKLETIYN